jgi:hypothetical protein
MELLLKKLEPIQIRMDGDKNHGRAHIHINYKRQFHVASYAIDDGSRLAGSLDRQYDRTVKAWIEENRAKLLLVWEKVQSGEKPDGLIAELRG